MFFAFSESYISRIIWHQSLGSPVENEFFFNLENWLHNAHEVKKLWNSEYLENHEFSLANRTHLAPDEPSGWVGSHSRFLCINE